MSGMDQRTSTRYVTSLNALVHPKVGKAWLCTIKDFCEGGMLLVEQEGKRSPRGKTGINTGDSVGLNFSVPLSNSDEHFRLEGKIVRVMDSGVGINFTQGMADKAMHALAQFTETIPVPQSPEPIKKDGQKKVTSRTPGKVVARKNKTASESTEKSAPDENSPFADGSIDPADSRKLVAAIRKGLVRILPEMTTILFKYMDAVLLEMARDSKSNAEQSEYFAAMTNLEKAKKAVSQQFIVEVLDQVDKPRDLETLLEERKKVKDQRKQVLAAKRIKLSLINTEQFEDWLAVANIISRSERIYDKYYQELLPRMGMMVNSWGYKEANPLGASVCCHAFDDAIQNLDLPREIRQKIYSGYEAKVTPLFRRLYVAVTKLLEDSKLFPELDEDYIMPSSMMTSGRSNASSEPPVAEESGVEEDEELDRSNEDGDLEGEHPENLDRRRVGRERRGRRRNQNGPRTGAARTRKTDTSTVIGDIYSTVRRLIRQPEALHEEHEEHEDHDDDVELDEMLGILQRLQKETDPSSDCRMPVRQKLLDSSIVEGRQRRLSESVLERIDIVENLVDTIEDDSMISGSAKGWIRQLELTLDKVAAQRQNFLDKDNPHTSLNVLNQLARLGGAESASVQRKVEEIIGEINQNYDSDPEIFDGALSKLQPLIERQSRAFTGNVERTVKASEGKQTLINAQRAVVDEMEQRFAGREVPEVLMKLLMPGWRNLLVNTHLRQGQESVEWKNHIRVLDQVMDHLDTSVNAKESPYYLPPDVLVEQIESGLNSISFEPGQRVPLVDSLRKLLANNEAKKDLPMVNMADGSMLEALGFSNVREEEEKRHLIHENNKDNEEWYRQLERVRNLHVGDWVELSPETEKAEIAIVAWVSEGNSRIVFVNRRGIKIDELTIEDLATMVIEGTVRILEDADIPLTDRASHRMLQNMHNELTHQATHDELTGLVNRKEFEHQLLRILGLAKRKKIPYVVAFLDLDQFKVVNNIGGHEAGDKLLIELSREIENIIPQDTILARLGGDEFGLLLEDCDQEDGMAIIQNVCAAVKDFRFEWEKEVFSITVSCGVVNVDEETDSVANILSGADSACYMAKEAGRDRVHVYKSDDSELAHRKDVMEFVSRIDKSLEENRFILNCQLIKPIDENSQELAHYEILLTILDGNDEPMPPQDFIIAAETYNRMGAIDRWVIKNAFRFIASNILRLDHLGAFSINVSGNSLTEDDFMEFVLEQFNETRLPASKICFEITETAAIGNLDNVIEFIEKMQVIGVQFSLDDFGTGLSSYSYLRSLPVDFLKIDGIFVKDIKNSPSDYAVVKSINEIGHFMGKKTIAEFVEDDDVLEILKEIGVDFAQGYGIGMKMPITELLD